LPHKLHGAEAESSNVRAPLEKTARALTEPFVDFVTAQSASGWLLLSAVVLALVWANSTWADSYFAFRDSPIELRVAHVELAMTLREWVNDGLMAVFFFLLGLELKRELLVGRLSAAARAAAVLCAAAGGMLLPALLFLLATDSTAVRAGWAIPVATDTAFALMLLVMLGDRIPAAARAFLVGLAIIDDLGAILVIALAYTTSFDAALILPTAAALGALAMLNLAGVRNGIAYLLVGCIVWLLFMGLGLHTTLAGIVVACAAPVRPAIPRGRFLDQIKRQARRFETKQRNDTASILEQPEQQQIAADVVQVATKATVPLNRWEARLERPVSMLVMPAFAFCSAPRSDACCGSPSCHRA
jgi:NhaA family Na+:H+ antiporter